MNGNLELLKRFIKLFIERNGSAPADIARALMHLAANPELRTPAMLAQPGPHWQRPDGTSARRDTHARAPDSDGPQCARGDAAPAVGLSSDQAVRMIPPTA